MWWSCSIKYKLRIANDVSPPSISFFFSYFVCVCVCVPFAFAANRRIVQEIPTRARTKKKIIKLKDSVAHLVDHAECALTNEAQRRSKKNRFVVVCGECEPSNITYSHMHAIISKPVQFSFDQHECDLLPC